MRSMTVGSVAFETFETAFETAFHVTGDIRQIFNGFF